MTQDNPAGPAPAATNAAEFFIPYKNGYALAAYYMGIFSFIPLLGLFLGIAAFFCGLKGLRLAKEHPEARGKAHAWVGIIAGGLFGFGQLALAMLMAVGLVLSVIG
jgi:hypothetical protein